MKTFFKQRLISILNALNGIKEGFKTETHLKIHAAIALGVILAGVYFKISAAEWALQSLTIASVISLELINTSIERFCDFFHPKKSLQIGKIKDLSAAAVLIASIASFVIGSIIYLPKLAAMFGF